jgi:hypothetical protein
MCCALLRDVRKLVREQPVARVRPRREAAARENDVGANCERFRRNGVRRPRRSVVGMDAHGAEVVSESGLHGRPGPWVERPAGRAEDVVHRRRREDGRSSSALRAAGRALAAVLDRAAAGAAGRCVDARRVRHRYLSPFGIGTGL